MNRPAPIDTLDTALHAAVDQLDNLDASVATFLDENIETLDAYSRLLGLRAAGYASVRRTEQAILTLGHQVVRADGSPVDFGESILGDRGYSTEADEEAARLRANPPEPGPEEAPEETYPNDAE